MDTLTETPQGEDSDEEDVAVAHAPDEGIIEISEQESIEEKETHDVFALPIRAKPLFLNNNEDVVEFTLTESKDGLKSTSIIVGEGLFRIVETKIHPDGIPRVDLKVALDSELTGFQHIVGKPTKVEIGVSCSLFFIGLILCLFPFPITMVLGISAILFGIKSAPDYMENHRLVFSSGGSSHVFNINLIGVFKPSFRASMALIGPTLAKYMKTGNIDSTSIDELHASLRSPLPVHQPIQLGAPPQMNEQMPVGPPAITENHEVSSTPVMKIQTPTTPTLEKDMKPAGVIPPPPQSKPQVTPQQSPIPPPPKSKPQVTPQQSPIPPPPKSKPQVMPQPNTLPPPPKGIPEQIRNSQATPPPPQTKPQAVPLPPVMPLSQTSMQGFDSASLPLDAPLPEAPRIPVAAAPQEQVVSQEITDALMDELSD